MRLVRTISFLIFLSLPVASAVRADVLVVLNKSDHEAALVDPATLEVIAKLPTGMGPHEVAISPDGALAYVTNYGGWAMLREGEEPKREAGKSLTVLDLKARSVKATWDLGESGLPHGIAASRDGKKLWVTAEGAHKVLEIDAATGAIDRTFVIRQQVSHMLVPTPDDRKLYVANIASGNVSIIDRASGKVRSVTTGAGSEGIDVSPDGREVWVSNRAADTISVIETATDTVVATFPSGGKFPIRVRFAPDGSQVLVSNANSNSVSVFEASSRKLLGTIEVGALPVGIALSPDGSRAFVACSGADRVEVVDLTARKVVKSFSTGKEPDGMAWVRRRD